jgi:hypothetical protein
MWVIYLEMGLALALAAFIVWFTWPKKRGGNDARASSADKTGGDARKKEG